MKLFIHNDGLHLNIQIEVNLPRWLARFRRHPKRIPGLNAGSTWTARISTTRSLKIS
jgi:hypothetical protein